PAGTGTSWWRGSASTSSPRSTSACGATCRATWCRSPVASTCRDGPRGQAPRAFWQRSLRSSRITGQIGGEPGDLWGTVPTETGTTGPVDDTPDEPMSPGGESAYSPQPVAGRLTSRPGLTRHAGRVPERHRRRLALSGRGGYRTTA